MSTLVSGNHNDLFNIEYTFEEFTAMIEDATFSVDELFISCNLTQRAYINYAIKNKLSPILLLTKGTLLAIMGLTPLTKNSIKKDTLLKELMHE